MAEAHVHMIRRREPWIEDKSDTSSERERGSQSTPAASRTALQAKRAKGHRKNAWSASSASAHKAQGPEAGPLRLAILIEVGRRSWHSCHRKTLIFSGIHAFQSPVAAIGAWPRHNSRYRDLTVNLPEPESLQETTSVESDRRTFANRARRRSQSTSSCPTSSRLKCIGGGVALRAEATNWLGSTAME